MKVDKGKLVNERMLVAELVARMIGEYDFAQK